jgi:hypothetical protein
MRSTGLFNANYLKQYLSTRLISRVLPQGALAILFLRFARRIFGVESMGSGEDAGVCPDAACIFLHGAIADIMVAVLDAPMAMDRLSGFFGAYVRGEKIE